MVSAIDFLYRSRARILEAWSAGARVAASARGLSDVELRNLMPVCLAALTGGADMAELHRHIESHLAHRIRWGFEIAEIVEEFAVLERCIGKSAIEALPSDRPPAEELAGIFEKLQDIVVRTTDAFQEHMRLDEQREKRYLRLLRTLADEALRTPAEPLTTRLKEVLGLVMEAMDAQCAALFLYDPQTERLVMKAAVGAAEAQLEEYATSLEPSTFTGTIAAHEETTSIFDAATTELEVSEALRGSGIHSLLGVRLPPHIRLLGVMYIGVRAQRSFSARESRRLEALGEGLTLHLDNAKLHEEIRERVQELEAERSLREQFIAILAHDLRGPLASAKMNTQMLTRSGERADPRRTTVLGRIDRSLDRVDQMIRDLLDVSRMHAGQPLPLHVAECDLRELAEEVATELRSIYGPRFLVASEGAVHGQWSRDELRRALWNLAVNAVKYGRDDTPITIRSERRADRVRLSVHNLGDPIPPDSRERIFDVFTRRKAAPLAGESWGLGLALVRACAQAHGGTVEVDSTSEAGTTFTLDLPPDARPYDQEHG